MHEIRIPKLGMDTTDCEIQQWLVKLGDHVSPSTPVLEVESEKAVITIEAGAEGTVRELRAQPGQTVAVGSVVGLIDGGAEPK